MKEKLKQIFISNQDTFSGVCLVRNSSETIFSAASGLANRDYNIPNTMETMFDTASVTKVFTTAGDLALFLRAIQNGKLLSSRFTEIFLQPHCQIARPSYGFTWRTGYAFEFLERDGKVVCMYKEGVNAGVNAMFSYYPDLDISLNLLSNQEDGFWEMHKQMQEILLSANEETE